MVSGVAYAVLLGLILVVVWQSWEVADSNSTEEANELAAIFWLAHGLPESEGRHIQELARSYAREVVDDEWQKMARGEESFKAWAILDEMRGSILALEPDTNPTNCCTTTRCSGYTNWLTPGRNASCKPTRSFPPSSGPCFLIGGVIVVAFTYLFGLQSTLVHTLMVAALAVTIALCSLQ